MLPALLAAYKTYGSLAFGCPVHAIQCCSKGAVADTTKKGMPTETAKRSKSQSTGRAGSRGCSSQVEIPRWSAIVKIGGAAPWSGHICSNLNGRVSKGNSKNGT